MPLLRLIGKSLFQRPLRYLLTGFAIVFSVAAVSAVFIFTDGLRITFNELATNIESGYDIAVQPQVGFGDGSLVPTVPLDQRDLVASQPGVLAVQPRVVGIGVVAVDANNEPTFAPSGPNLGVLWGDELPVTRYFLQVGRQPVGPGEFALDVDAFNQGDYTIGDEYVVQVPTEIESGRTFTLVGTFTFANPDRNALVGARLVAFDESTAVQLINDGEGYSDLTIALQPGTDRDALMADLSTLVDDSLEIKTQEEVLEDTQGSFGEVLDIFQTVLLVFAIIILFVSSFLIYNVFTITLGQRIRELGLLRAVGAYGSQITRMMLGEALLLGVAATVLGIPAGVALAWVLKQALIALGFPDNTGLPLSGWTTLWAVFTGIVVTMGAAVWPSIQARRVPPIAALREGANISELESFENRPLGMLLTGVGVVLLVVALVLSGWQVRIGLPALGTLLIFSGLLLCRRPIASLVVLPIGILLLVVTLLLDASLGETFALLGAGAFVTLMGVNLVNPLIARQLTDLLGRGPTALAVGLAGVVLVAVAIASIVGGVIVAVTGVPTALVEAVEQDIPAAALVVPAIIAAVVFALAGYAIIRTALGARGLTGQLARSNAARNPKRTATTAAALMIGLALVTAVTVIGDSIKSSVSTALSSSITADWFVRNPTAGPTPIPFSPSVAERVLALDEVESVVPFRVAFPAAWVTSDGGELNAEDFRELLPLVVELVNDDEVTPERILAIQAELGTDVQINDAVAVNFADLPSHVDPEWVGRDDELSRLPNAIYLFDEFAEEQGLTVGDSFSALFVDLQSEDLVVAGIYENGFVLGARVITLDMWERHFSLNSDQFLTVRTTNGVTAEVARAAINDEIGDDFPTLDVQDRDEFAEAQELQINQLLATVNVLLGLSAVIAALGILLALALSVFERTREIGLFRAVGATRRQTRWMIRWEGVIVAAFGGSLGVALGLVLGVLATAKMPVILVNEISVPYGTLAVYMLFSALVGVGAAAFPAWLAGRMNVLEAISSE